MKKTALLFSSILFVFITGCATDYSLMDSDSHSTKQISPRENAHLSCLAETEENISDTSEEHDITVEPTGKCMRLKEYTLKNPLPSGVKTDKWGCPLDTDGDGVPDYLDECPGTPECVKVDDKGCPLDTDGDGVPDYLDKCPGTPEGVNVDDRGCPLDTDGDGVPDYLDECSETPEYVEVDDSGCPVNTDGDGVADYLDKCPGTPYGAIVDEQGCWVIGDALYAIFDFDKYKIKPLYYFVLDEAVAVLRKNPDLKIEIQGHTCSMGTEAYNKKLSERRANAIMNYFIKKGIDETRLSAVGYGLSKPRASNETEAGRILNRRVEFMLHTP